MTSPTSAYQTSAIRSPAIFLSQIIVAALWILLSILIHSAVGATDSLSPDDLKAASASSEAIRFYADRGFGLAWVQSGEQLPVAQSMLRTMAASSTDGLLPEVYDAAGLGQRWQAHRSPQELGRLDLAMTEAALRYLGDLTAGRVAPNLADPRWRIPRTLLDPVSVLSMVLSAADPDRTLAELTPPHGGYRALKAALARYRAIAASGGWPQLPQGESLRLGDRDDRVEILRQRLALEGASPLAETATGDPRLFDARLESGVRFFQERYGLKADGMVGVHTRDTLNIPVEERVSQIARSMERWRWLPRDLGRRHILVNIPGFVLSLVDNGTVVLESRIIAGRSSRPSPRIAAKATGILVNPSWTIPSTIMREDVLPVVRKDPSWLTRQQMRVFQGWGADSREVDPMQVDWRAVLPTRIPYRIVQEPGPNNALGRLKIEMPNPAGVYLHDTPAKRLFDEADRARSSGCIRIERVKELAAALLGEGWTVDRLNDLIDRGRSVAISFREPVPVYLVYFPAWVDEAGTIHFSPDIYGLDDRSGGSRGDGVWPVPPAAGAPCDSATVPDPS